MVSAKEFDDYYLSTSFFNNKVIELQNIDSIDTGSKSSISEKRNERRHKKVNHQNILYIAFQILIFIINLKNIVA